jgi:septal ring factor EnvC (AmiA/AmiB activator)
MDWVVVALILGTGVFLVAILRDFQNIRQVRFRRLQSVREQIEKVEKDLQTSREREAKVKIETESAHRDLSEVERIKSGLHKALEARAQKRR